MSAPHPQAERLLEKLKCYALFAELFDYYLGKQDLLQAHLAEQLFVEPATVSHWRKNRRIPENLGILHRVNLALKLSTQEQENLVVAWYMTRTVRDLVPYLEEALRTGQVDEALQIVQHILGNSLAKRTGTEVKP